MKTRLFKYIEKFTSKNWIIFDKNLWYLFIFLLKTLIVGTRKNRLGEVVRGGSNEYPQSMFLSRNKKN